MADRRVKRAESLRDIVAAVLGLPEGQREALRLLMSRDGWVRPGIGTPHCRCFAALVHRGLAEERSVRGVRARLYRADF